VRLDFGGAFCRVRRQPAFSLPSPGPSSRHWSRVRRPGADLGLGILAVSPVSPSPSLFLGPPAICARHGLKAPRRLRYLRPLSVCWGQRRHWISDPSVAHNPLEESSPPHPYSLATLTSASSASRGLGCRRLPRLQHASNPRPQRGDTHQGSLLPTSNQPPQSGILQP